MISGLVRFYLVAPGLLHRSIKALESGRLAGSFSAQESSEGHGIHVRLKIALRRQYADVDSPHPFRGKHPVWMVDRPGGVSPIHRTPCIGQRAAQVTYWNAKARPTKGPAPSFFLHVTDLPSSSLITLWEGP